MKKIAPVMLALLIGTVSLFASGCVGCRFCKADLDGRATMIADWVAKDLKFTKDQKAKLDVIKNDIVTKMKPKIADREKLHGDVMTLVLKEKVTKDEVLRLMDRHEATRKDMKPFIAQKIAEFHAILTPEQKKKITERMEKFHKRCGLKK